MNELIERLKQNEKPYGLLTEEERECFESIGKNNCLFFDGVRWHPCNTGEFFREYAYRISPKYQVEPEVVKCEVKKIKDSFREDHLRYFRGNYWRHLTESLNDPDFMYFEYEDGRQGVESVVGRYFNLNNNDPAEWPKFVVFRK